MGDRNAPALHVGIDAREVAGRPTGVGRFLANVLQTWAADPALAHRFTLFLPAAGPDWLERLGDRFAVVRDPAAKGGSWWEQVRLPRLAARAGVDVLLSPGYTAPLRLPCPSVVVIHDVSFFAHPEWFPWREGLRRRWLTRRAARRAAVVVTVSEFSAAEIERWIGVPRPAIRVVAPRRAGRLARDRRGPAAARALRGLSLQPTEAARDDRRVRARRRARPGRAAGARRRQPDRAAPGSRRARRRVRGQPGSGLARLCGGCRARSPVPSAPGSSCSSPSTRASR